MDMNKDRRKRLTEITEQLELLKGQLESLRDEEQDAFDAMPESLQGGERGQAMESAVSSMEEVADALDEVVSNIQLAIDGS